MKAKSTESKRVDGRVGNVLWPRKEDSFSVSRSPWLLALAFAILVAGQALAQGASSKSSAKKCVSDCECPAGQLCSPKSGSCEIVFCLQVFDPVCGLDGKTYGNACEAGAQHIVIAHRGECSQECGGLVGKPCTQKDQFCEEPPGQCHPDGIGRCETKPEVCTKEFRPVCGCDMKTYGNDCQRRAAGVSLLWEGPCSWTATKQDTSPPPLQTCWSNSDCGAKDYCSRPEGLCDSDQGHCRNRPMFCPDLYDPVCGCNGVTYSNTCYANAAGVNVRHQGACGKR